MWDQLDKLHSGLLLVGLCALVGGLVLLLDGLIPRRRRPKGGAALLLGVALLVAVGCASTPPPQDDSYGAAGPVQRTALGCVGCLDVAGLCWWASQKEHP